MTERRPDPLEADLSAYLDGELDERRAAEIRHRLAESEQMRQTLEDLRAVSDQLSTLPRHQAPDELMSAMRRHAERRLLLDDPPPHRWWVLRRVLQFGAAAAVLAACVLVGYELIAPAMTPVQTELVGLARDHDARTPPTATPPETIVAARSKGTRTEFEKLAKTDPSAKPREDAADELSSGYVPSMPAPTAQERGRDEDMRGDGLNTTMGRVAGADVADEAPPTASAIVPDPSRTPAASGGEVSFETNAKQTHDAYSFYSVEQSETTAETWSEVDVAPSVDVVVQSTTLDEFVANQALLDRWGSDVRFGVSAGGSAKSPAKADGGACRAEMLDDAVTPPQSGEVRLLVHLPADDIRGRIDALVQNVRTPNQVMVQTNFLAGQRGLFARVMAPSPEEGGDGDEGVSSKLLNSPEYDLFNINGPMFMLGEPIPPEATPSRGLEQSPQSRRDEKFERLHRRHQAALGPEIIVIEAPPAASQPRVGEPVASAAPASAPASRPSTQPEMDNDLDRPEMPIVSEVAQHLWGFLRGGLEVLAAPPEADSLADAEAEPEEPSLTFRVTLLPPPAASQPHDRRESSKTKKPERGTQPPVP